MSALKIRTEVWDIAAADRERMRAAEQASPAVQATIISAFEARVATQLARRHAVACASATGGLQHVFEVYGLGPGDEVVVSAYSWHGIARAVWRVGATPVFADIDYWSGTLNPEKAAAKIGPATRAILVGNTNGHPADWTAFEELRLRHDLILIEDSTEAIGSTYEGRPVGCFGDVSLFDFQARGPVAGGAGALVLTDDVRLAQALGEHVTAGRKADVMSASTAALLDAQWGRLEDTLAARASVAALYGRHIRSFEGIKDPYTGPRVSAHHAFTFLVHLGARFSRQARDAIVDDLCEGGIEARAYAIPLYRDEECRRRRLSGAGCGLTDKIADRGIVLPFYAGLAEEEIARIVESLKDASINVGAGSAIYL